MQSLSLDFVWTYMYLENTALPAIYPKPSLVQTDSYVSNTAIQLNVSSMRSSNGTLNATPSALLILEGVALYNISFVESASLLLGTRLRQLRVSPRQCSNAIAASLAQYFARCYPEYSHVDEDSSEDWWSNDSTATRNEFAFRLIPVNSVFLVIAQ